MIYRKQTEEENAGRCTDGGGIIILKNFSNTEESSPRKPKSDRSPSRIANYIKKPREGYQSVMRVQSLEHSEGSCPSSLVKIPIPWTLASEISRNGEYILGCLAWALGQGERESTCIPMSAPWSNTRLPALICGHLGKSTISCSSAHGENEDRR